MFFNNAAQERNLIFPAPSLFIEQQLPKGRIRREIHTCPDVEKNMQDMINKQIQDYVPFFHVAINDRFKLSVIKKEASVI